MRRIRAAANAGTFYPADPATLIDMIAASIGKTEPGACAPKALIAPHAGYIYSGRIAGAAYGRLAEARGKVSRVVLLGPSHRHRFAGMALTTAAAYETPLGRADVDQDWLARAHDLPFVGFSDEAHELDHSLETHVPFIQVVLGGVKIAPIVCGRADVDQVAALLDRLWGGSETIIAISTDLSHYLDYDACSALDRTTQAAIEQLDWNVATPTNACGAVALNGLLAAARRRHMRIETLDRCNSGDTAGPRDRVVGYGAWALWEAGAATAQQRELVLQHGELLNDIARQSICGGSAAASRDEGSHGLGQPGASFVTLRKNGRLRGCYGSASAWRPLVDDIRANARKSALEDPRFPPLDKAEWPEVALSVSLLTPLRPMRFVDEQDLLGQLVPGRDGLVIEDSGRSALFLPSVWKSFPARTDFLTQLKLKAGMPGAHWSQHFRAHRFETFDTISEPMLAV